MKVSNFEIRKHAKEKGVYFWEVAEFLGISEPTMTRKMRRELDEVEKQKILKVIDELAKKRSLENAENADN